VAGQTDGPERTPVVASEEVAVELHAVPIEKPEDMNVIVGQAHFIKTVEDVHEALVGISPHLRFGVAFCEASGPCLVRRSGNDDRLVDLATRNAVAVGAGHSFIVFVEEGYPVNVLNAMKQVAEVCTIFCATANPVEIVVAETDLGRGIVGVVDGRRPAGVESDSDVADRKALLRAIGYKL
jgi:adenosine/AMP kinase